MGSDKRQMLILATGNRDKVRELSEMIDPEKYEVLSKAEVGLADFEVEEDGATLEENAEKKAREIARALREEDAARARFEDALILADDTGLFVDALGGAPGVYSARYAGEHCSYQDNVAKLLEAMRDVADDARTAVFRTVIAVVRGEACTLVRGALPGRIARAARGEHGFGYDPVFELSDGRTLAQCSDTEKNEISHRARAYRKLIEWMDGVR
ncbi:MAG: RdgB/HAM1 family non-canonical purine NTP pyrophosphatase [Ndongobacter sp.]|nr:RdgB/HAM1 family non-canonical purine NTP pyrophosphatase [Ndongobacter sp.]